MGRQTVSNNFSWAEQATHVFQTVSNNFSWAEQATLATLHDRPWTAIRLARLSRKHGIKDVVLFSLAQLTDCAMDVNDAYSKLREQILTNRDGAELERTCGLNQINTTNLSYFDTTQKSELFRMKAEYLDGLGSRSKATNAYCNSVQICPTSSRSWSIWVISAGRHIDFLENKIKRRPTWRTVRIVRQLI